MKNIAAPTSEANFFALAVCLSNLLPYSNREPVTKSFKQRSRAAPEFLCVIRIALDIFQQTSIGANLCTVTFILQLHDVINLFRFEGSRFKCRYRDGLFNSLC